MTLNSQIRTAICIYKRKLGIRSDVNKISTRYLGFGENNNSIYVCVNEKYEFTFRIAMKRSRKGMRIKEKHMQNEFKLLQKLPKGIAPTAYIFDKSKKIIPRAFCILSYVPGEIKPKWTNKEIRLHAYALAKLHHKKFSFLEEEGKRRKQLDFYKHYLENWLPSFKIDKSDKQIRMLLPMFKTYLISKNHLFTKMKSFTRIHGDLCNDNILFSKNIITYIDWEWAKISDPARDVARVFSLDYSFEPWYVKFSKKQRQLLLKEYFSKNKVMDKVKFERRVGAWSIVMSFSDFLYFKWKVRHFGTQESGYPKSTYVRAVKVMFKPLLKRLE